MISWESVAKTDPSATADGTDFMTPNRTIAKVRPDKSRHLRAIVGIRCFPGKAPKRKGKNTRKILGAPAGIRTPNQQIMSLLL